MEELTFEPSFKYKIYKLTAELHLTRNKDLFNLENLKLVKKSYDKRSMFLFIPYPFPKFEKLLTKVL